MDIEQVKKYFSTDKFAQYTGAVIEAIGEREAVCALPLEQHHLNAAGIVQGGAIFTLADFAFAVASNMDDIQAGNGAVSVGQSCNIVFFKSTKGKKLTAKATCLHKGGRISIYRVAITDDMGINIAEMTGNAYRIAR